MRVSNPDIRFFQSYGNVSKGKVAHHSSKRDFWVKNNAPESNQKFEFKTSVHQYQLEKTGKHAKDIEILFKEPTSSKSNNFSKKTSERENEISEATKPRNQVLVNRSPLPKHQNYYLPLTETFHCTMVPQFSNAQRAIENSRLSLQQVLQNQRNEQGAPNVTETPSKTKECVAPPKPAEDGSWTTVKSSKPAKSKNVIERATFPSKFPLYVPNSNEADSNMTQVKPVGITFTIKLPNSHEVTSIRFLQAMLTCFKLADPGACIVPFDTLHETNAPRPAEKLSNPQDVVTHGTHLEKYMEEPNRKYGSSEFTARVVFCTSIPINDIFTNEKVMEWFRQERVRAEENNLATAHPTNVGFLTLAISKQEVLPLYQARIKQLLGESSPEFHLSINAIFPERPKNTQEAKANQMRFVRTQVIMIRASLLDVKEINTALQRFEDHNEIIYRPWKEYLSLSSGQKRTVVLEQENFMKNHRSFIVKNLNETALQLKMHSSEEGDEMMTEQNEAQSNTAVDLTQVTITEFISNHYKACDGQNLFMFTYTPIKGMIELVVKKQHAVEAEDCFEYIDKDLMYFCNIATREQLFQPNLVQETSFRNYQPLRPYKWFKKVSTTDVPDESENKRRRKTMVKSAPIPTQVATTPPARIPTYASITQERKPIRQDGNETTETQTSEMTSYHPDGGDTYTLQQTCENMQKSMMAQEARMIKLEEQLKTQATETVSLVEKRIGEAAIQTDRRIAASEQKQEIILNGTLDRKCDTMMAQISALFKSTMAAPIQLSETSCLKEDLGTNKTMTPRKRIGQYCSEKDGSDSEGSVENESQ